MTGLVLTGGGARAAYQAGVVQGIAEILGPDGESGNPFPILAGVSAGAINSAFLAAGAEDFQGTAARLARMWRGLRSQQVMRTDVASLGGLGARWLGALSFGSGREPLNYLIDASPLRGFLANEIDFGAIAAHVEKGDLRGIGVSATNYATGTAITFFDAHPGVAPWTRSSRIGKRARVELAHVLASAAIPIFFRPVFVDGAYFGDGCVRLNTPLSPAIHLGADRVIAVGIRHQRSDATTRGLNETPATEPVSMADIGGVMLNAIFLDSLDGDLERMERINRTLELIPPARLAQDFSLRRIPVLAIKPSVDLGTLAREQFDRFPWMLRHLLAGLGASRERGWELLSYLAFDESYTGALVDLGRSDALARASEIRDFMISSRSDQLASG